MSRAALRAMALWVLLGALPVLGWPSFCAARDGAHGQAEGREGGEAEKAWFAHREFLAKGDWARSRAELEKVYQWKLNQGIRNHYAYSHALIRESRRVAEEGKGQEISAELLAYAERMAPDFSSVSRARAGWLAARIPESWENATRAVSAWARGLLLALLNPQEAFSRIANLSLWILFGYLFAFAAFALCLLFRYYPFFAHHLKHLARLRMSAAALMAAAFLFLFSPLFLGWGLMWLFVLWVLVFWTYQSRAERGVTLVLLGLLLLLPTGARFQSSLLHSLSGGGISEILRANTGAWDADLHRDLLAMSRANPGDCDLLLSVGLLEKRMGWWSDAEEKILQCLQSDPSSGAALNNLGNVFLATNRLDQAMAAFQQAIRRDPARFESYYNLGQSYLLKLRMKEAEEEFQKAKNLDSREISYHTSISSRNPNRLVVDRTLDTYRVWRRALASSPQRDQVAGALWGVLWEGVSLQGGEIALGALFGLLGLVHLLSRRVSLIRSCERCGTLICSRCTHSRVMGNQCAQCLNAFAAGTSADPAVVRVKRSEVASHQARLHVLPRRISFALPGAGHLIRGRAKEGVSYLFVLGLFLAQAVWWGGWVPDPLALGDSGSTPRAASWVLLFIAFYAWVQYRMERIRLQGGKSHFQKA